MRFENGRMVLAPPRRLYAGVNQPSPAIKAFNEVLQINPRVAVVHLELAKLYLTIDEPGNSSRAWR